MKSYSVPLDARQAETLFKPIRNKRDAIDILMKTVKILTIQSPGDVQHKHAEVQLIVSKMSRLFFFSKHKYFSLSLPFSVELRTDHLPLFYSSEIPNIDSRVTSLIIALISNDELFNINGFYEFFEPIADLESDEAYIWPFILRLFMYDDGYIRYDADQKNANGRLHPVNHYDVFYSSSSTFKIGLNKGLKRAQIVDLLDISTDCHFLE